MTGRRILSLDKAARGETVWLLCCWAECERQGVDLYKTRHHAHATGLKCDDPLSKHPIYVFCSERHRQYFLHSHVKNGQLPPGSRNRIS